MVWNRNLANKCFVLQVRQCAVVYLMAFYGSACRKCRKIYIYIYIFLKIFFGAFVPLYIGQLKSGQETGQREGE